MNVLMTGSTGLIGRATIAYLQSNGHSVTAMVRNVDRAKSLLGQDTTLLGPEITDADIKAALESSDAVVNLAGSPISGIRWNSKKKKSFSESRIGITKLLADNINSCESPPKVMVSASAVGYYGDSGDVQLTEASPRGSGYLANLCEKWENTALAVQSTGTRSCILRLGVVLGREGGILRLLSPGLELGIATFLGNGKQYIPWVHLIDVVRIIGTCLDKPSLNGTINCTSPHPVTGKEFALQIGRAFGTKLTLGIPEIFLRLIFGEGATVMTGSHNVVPQKLLDSGFAHWYPELQSAADDLLRDDAISIRRADPGGNRESGAEHSPILKVDPQYELKTSMEIERASSEAYSFFSSPLNLGMATPSWVNFRVLDMPLSMEKDTEMVYKFRLGPLNIEWKTRIACWQPNDLFIDFQEKGPYKLWWHEHRIVKTGIASCTIEDRIIYRIPGGFMGRLLHALVIKRLLTRIFGFRRAIIRLRFNSG